MRVIDFLKLHGGEDDECVSLYECDDMLQITFPISYLLEDWSGERKLANILEGEIASWEYENRILCILYFKN